MLQSLVLKIIVTHISIKFVGILLCTPFIKKYKIKEVMNRYGTVSPKWLETLIEKGVAKFSKPCMWGLFNNVCLVCRHEKEIVYYQPKRLAHKHLFFRITFEKCIIKNEFTNRPLKRKSNGKHYANYWRFYKRVECFKIIET